MCTVGLMLSGCVISDTMPGSPSFACGQIKMGDVITEVLFCTSCVCHALVAERSVALEKSSFHIICHASPHLCVDNSRRAR